MTSGPLYAVTVVGNDRPGIVAETTKVLYDLGCNLEDATSTILRGHFSMMLVVRVPEDVDGDRIESSLEHVASKMALVTTARGVQETEVDVAEPTHMVSVYGADKPGIVFKVADALARDGANITDLPSRVIGTDEPVYALMLEVVVPAGVQVNDVLASLKEELGVEVSVHPIQADVL